MNKLSIFLAGLLALVILLSGGASSGCGGGSGSTTGTNTSTTGGDTLVTGRVLSIATGGALSPAPTVQTDEGRVTASADGAFSVGADAGNETVVVDAGAFGVFQFPATVANDATTEVGDLYVGPERITLTGTLRSAATGTPIPNALVTFGGQRDATDANGIFALANVAYASNQNATFLGLAGTIRATGFVPQGFTTEGRTPSSGLLNLGEIRLAPESGNEPPGLPFTIVGNVSPFADAPGTVVSLRAGSTEIRRATVGGDGTYGFWVAPGTYGVTFTKGSRTAGPFTVTLADTTSVVRRDATLP